MKTFFKINIECFSKWAQMYDPLLRDYNSSPIFWRVGNLIHVNFSVLYFCFTIAKRCKTLKRHPKCELFRKKHNQISVGDSTGVKTRLLISSAKDRPALGHRMSVVQLQRSQSRDTRLLEEGRARIFQRGKRVSADLSSAELTDSRSGARPDQTGRVKSLYIALVRS